MRRRGQIIERGDNRYTLRINLGSDASGKRLVTSKTVHCPREEAETILRQALMLADEGSMSPFGFTASVRDASPTTKIKIGSTGAASELMVCIDLLRRGYDVYRSVAACGACDIIALANGSPIACRIEVKTAHRRGDADALRFAAKTLNPSNHDILALVVLKGGRITYEPDLTEWFAARRLSLPSGTTP